MIGEVFVLILLAAFFFGGLFSVVKGLGHTYRGLLIWRNEPIPAKEVRISDGHVEVEGKVQSIDGSTIEAKYSGKDVVAHDWEKQITSNTGPNSPSVETISSGEGGVPFYVFDSTGYVAVDPEEADLSLSKTMVSGREKNGEVKRLEGRLEEGDDVHVYGQKKTAEERDELDGINFYIGDGGSAPGFRITDGSETLTLWRVLGTGIFYILVGIILAVSTPLVLLSLAF